jgi:hypothetical protein
MAEKSTKAGASKKPAPATARLVDLANPEPGKGKGKGWASKYKPEYAKQTAKLVAKGYLLGECADFFDVSERTFRRWMALHEELFAATLIDISKANARVELTAYQLAVGYERMEEEIKVVEGTIYRIPVKRYYPPSPVSNIWWTKSKMGWRGEEGDGGQGALPAPDDSVGGAGVQTESLRQTARRIAFVLHQGGKK